MTNDDVPLSILEDKKLLRFAQKEFEVWLHVVASPLGVISKINLHSFNAITPALAFGAFTYAATLLVALPEMFLYEHVSVENKIVVTVDFVLTAIGFSFVGLTFYLAGKLLGGRGQLRGSMITGFYLTALWPIIQAFDYVLLLQNLPRVSPSTMGLVRVLLVAIVVVVVAVLIVAKASPVMAHVHRLGRVRAMIGVLMQGLLMFLVLYFVLGPMFQKMFGR